MLNLGGQYLFIGQQDYVSTLSNFAGQPIEESAHDLELLRILDHIPSLDPFILREWTRRAGLEIDGRYFDLDDVTAKAMEAFVVEELKKLVGLVVDVGKSPEAAARLVQKLLASEYDSDLDPFRTVFRFSVDIFPELMFCWKGFLYYKWLAVGIEKDLRTTLDELFKIKLNERDSETEYAITQSRKQIRATAAAHFNLVAGLINDYDSAFLGLINQGSSGRFREFLLESPQQFLKLGESIGVLKHIIQFWRFRYPKGPPVLVRLEDFVDLMRDFEEGLGISS